MKKALAIVMALVIALSMSAMAFAASENLCGKCGSKFEDNDKFAEHVRECTGTTAAPAAPANKVQCGLCNNIFEDENAFNDHLDVCYKTHNVCLKCNQNFADENAYNDHIAICTYGDEKDYINLTLKDLLTMIIDLVKVNAGQWDAIESVVIRLVDFIENMGKGLVSQAEVEGAVADLEAELANFSIPGVDEILNTIKSKIKNMYAGEKATTVVVETTTETTTEETTTEAVVIEDTGSASVGIAAFAAISVAAAAAYVCTKKKA